MKIIFSIVFILFCSIDISSSHSVDSTRTVDLSQVADTSKTIPSKILEYVKIQFPNDSLKQHYEYKRQIMAYEFMLTVPNQEVKSEVMKAHPNDFAMQKYLYLDKLSGRDAEQIKVRPSEFSIVSERIINIVRKQHPQNDEGQRALYDKQMSGYYYIQSVTDKNLKAEVINEFPDDYALQMATYQKRLEAKKQKNILS